MKKIYVVDFDLSRAELKISTFNLRNFVGKYPSLFIEAEDPDDACYLAMCTLADIIFVQKQDSKTAVLAKEVCNLVRITRVHCKDE